LSGIIGGLTFLWLNDISFGFNLRARISQAFLCLNGFSAARILFWRDRISFR
jgi:hypothetical protein